MNRKIIFMILIFVLPANALASIILPGDNFVPGWTTSGRLQRFLKNDLYGYIDGGAELFYEFGFQQLLVQGYKLRDREIVLEVYQMDSPEAALGVYLMKCGEEMPIDGVTARNSGNKYQFTIVHGSYLLQLNSFAGDERLIPVMTELCQQTLKYIPNEKPAKMFDDLPAEHLIPGSMRIIRGPYSLQPIYTFGEGDILQLKGQVFGLVGDYKDSGNGKYTQLVVRYPSIADALTAYNHLVSHLDPYLKVLKHTDNGIVFKDYQNKFSLVRWQENLVEIKIKLSQPPGF